jgi:hypothetical protein
MYTSKYQHASAQYKRGWVKLTAWILILRSFLSFPCADFKINIATLPELLVLIGDPENRATAAASPAFTCAAS